MENKDVQELVKIMKEYNYNHLICCCNSNTSNEIINLLHNNNIEVTLHDDIDEDVVYVLPVVDQPIKVVFESQKEIWFRPHRGKLYESMSKLVLFDSKLLLIKYIENTWPVPCDVSFLDMGSDERVGWHTVEYVMVHYVEPATGEYTNAVAGMCSQDVDMGMMFEYMAEEGIKEYKYHEKCIKF